MWKSRSDLSLRATLKQYVFYCAAFGVVVVAFAWIQFTMLLGQSFGLKDSPLPFLVGCVFGVLIVRNNQRSLTLADRLIEDPLTGTYNRYWLQVLAPTLLQPVLNHRQALSIILFDIDHFKRINDAHGHQTGDLVLQAIVQESQKLLRQADWLVRWGGEEFLVILPQTDIGGAHTTAEHLMQHFSNHAMAGVEQVTCSFGVAMFDASQDSDFDHLIGRADGLLYQAKQQGRNQVVADTVGHVPVLTIEQTLDAFGETRMPAFSKDWVKHWLSETLKKTYIQRTYGVFVAGFAVGVTTIAWLHIHVINGIHWDWLKMLMPPLCGGIFGMLVAHAHLLRKALQLQLTTDSLTGVHNRHWLEHYSQKLWGGAQRYGYSLTLAMVDVDHFKKVNDTFGHSAGDRVLCAVAMRLQEAAGESCSVMRWGGEEFLVVMPHLDVPQAMALAERMRTQVASGPIDKVGLVTVSIGVAAFDSARHSTLDALIADSDAVLYDCKRAGRNRVMAAGQTA
jgi:diguanylate cyclase (GGDEF)-like protein